MGAVHYILHHCALDAMREGEEGVHGALVVVEPKVQHLIRTTAEPMEGYTLPIVPVCVAHVFEGPVGAHELVDVARLEVQEEVGLELAWQRGQHFWDWAVAREI